MFCRFVHVDDEQWNPVSRDYLRWLTIRRTAKHGRYSDTEIWGPDGRPEPETEEPEVEPEEDGSGKAEADANNSLDGASTGDSADVNIKQEEEEQSYSSIGCIRAWEDSDDSSMAAGPSKRQKTAKGKSVLAFADTSLSLYHA